MHLVDVPKYLPKHGRPTAALFSRFNAEKKKIRKLIFRCTLQVLQVIALVKPINTE